MPPIRKSGPNIGSPVMRGRPARSATDKDIRSAGSRQRSIVEDESKSSKTTCPATPSRGRGRPPVIKDDNHEKNPKIDTSNASKGRGRPAKSKGFILSSVHKGTVTAETNLSEASCSEGKTVENTSDLIIYKDYDTEKRGDSYMNRDRRKNSRSKELDITRKQKSDNSMVVDSQLPRGRGRPPKHRTFPCDKEEDLYSPKRQGKVATSETTNDMQYTSQSKVSEDGNSQNTNENQATPQRKSSRSIKRKFDVKELYKTGGINRERSEQKQFVKQDRINMSEMEEITKQKGENDSRKDRTLRLDESDRSKEDCSEKQDKYDDSKEKENLKQDGNDESRNNLSVIQQDDKKSRMDGNVKQDKQPESREQRNVKDQDNVQSRADRNMKHDVEVKTRVGGNVKQHIGHESRKHINVKPHEDVNWRGEGNVKQKGPEERGDINLKPHVDDELRKDKNGKQHGKDGNEMIHTDNKSGVDENKNQNKEDDSVVRNVKQDRHNESEEDGVVIRGDGTVLSLDEDIISSSDKKILVQDEYGNVIITIIETDQEVLDIMAHNTAQQENSSVKRKVVPGDEYHENEPKKKKLSNMDSDYEMETDRMVYLVHEYETKEENDTERGIEEEQTRILFDKEEMQFRCFLCSEQIISSDTSPHLYKIKYRQHVIEKHVDPDGLINCLYCTRFYGPLFPHSTASRQWQVINNLTNHLLLHGHPAPSFYTVLQCIKCSYRTINQALYEKHVSGGQSACKKQSINRPGKDTKSNEEYTSKTFRCFVCNINKEYSRLGQLCEHFLLEHISMSETHNTLACPLCPSKMYRSKRSEGPKGNKRMLLHLLEHMIMKHKITPPPFADDLFFQCHECNFCSLSRSNFRDHYQIHVKNENIAMEPQEEGQTYSCPLCSAAQSEPMLSWADLREHFKNEHIQVEKEEGTDIPRKYFVECVHCEDGKILLRQESSVWSFMIVRAVEHMVREHNHPQPWYVTCKTCTKCVYWTFSSKAFSHHMVYHSKSESETMPRDMEEALSTDTAEEGPQKGGCMFCPGLEDVIKSWEELVEHHKAKHWRYSGDKLTWPCPHPGCETCFQKGVNVSWNRVVERTVNHMVEKHFCPIPPLVRVYRCGDCTFSSLVQDNMQCHQRNCHHGIYKDSRPETKHPCPTCKKYMSKRALYRHSESCPGLKKRPQVTCMYCGKRYNWKEGLKKHIRAVHLEVQEWKFPCNQCDEVFPENNLRLTHILEAHNENHSKRELLQCTQCSYRTLYKRHLDKHISRQHKTWLLPKCDFCDKVIDSSENYHKHRMQHIMGKLKPFPCQTCGAEFSFRQSLETHQKKEHGPDTSEHTLVLQILNMVNEQQPQQGMADLPTVQIPVHQEEPQSVIAVGDSQLVPEHCNEVITSSQEAEDIVAEAEVARQLEEEEEEELRYQEEVELMEQHAEEGETAIEIEPDLGHGHNSEESTVHLGRGQENIVMKKRLRQGTRKNFYCCDQCPLNFSNISALYNHMLKEHDTNISKKNVLKCDSCDYKTLFEYDMEKHRGAHERGTVKGPKMKREMPLKCSKCSYMTRYEVLMKRHMPLHNQGKMASKCEICGYVAMTLRGLEKHKETNHGPGKSDDPKPHKCEVENCIYAFRSRYDLENHMFSRHHQHWSHRPLRKCYRCGYQTLKSTQFQYHLATHTKVKETEPKKPKVPVLFKCYYCDYKSMRSWNVRKHLVTIHARQLKVKEGVDIRNVTVECMANKAGSKVDSKPTATAQCYKCNQCTFFTSMESGLRNHYKKIHQKRGLSPDKKAVTAQEVKNQAPDGATDGLREEQEVWRASEVLMLLCENAEPIPQDDLALADKEEESKRDDGMSDAVVLMMPDNQPEWGEEHHSSNHAADQSSGEEPHELQSATDLLMMLCEDTGASTEVRTEPMPHYIEPVGEDVGFSSPEDGQQVMVVCESNSGQTETILTDEESASQVLMQLRESMPPGTQFIVSENPMSSQDTVVQPSQGIYVSPGTITQTQSSPGVYTDDITTCTQSSPGAYTPEIVTKAKCTPAEYVSLDSVTAMYSATPDEDDDGDDDNALSTLQAEALLNPAMAGQSVSVEEVNEAHRPIKMEVGSGAVWEVTLENGAVLRLSGDQVRVSQTSDREECIEIPEESLQQAGPDAGEVVQVKVITN